MELSAFFTMIITKNSIKLSFLKNSHFTPYQKKNSQTSCCTAAKKSIRPLTLFFKSPPCRPSADTHPDQSQ
jgi:hypothetical protein